MHQVLNWLRQYRDRGDLPQTLQPLKKNVDSVSDILNVWGGLSPDFSLGSYRDPFGTDTEFC